MNFASTIYIVTKVTNNQKSCEANQVGSSCGMCGLLLYDVENQDRDDESEQAHEFGQCHTEQGKAFNGAFLGRVARDALQRSGEDDAYADGGAEHPEGGE